MKEAKGFGLSPRVKSVRSVLDKKGYGNAIAEVKKLQKKDSDFELSEREVNNWGYKLLAQKRPADALEIFKLNVYLYPQSANAFDSLGEIFAELGNTKLAIKNYAKSLKLNPENKNAEIQLGKLKFE